MPRLEALEDRTAPADLVHWFGSTSTAFGLGANWEGGKVPGDTDIPVFGAGAIREANLTANDSFQQIIFEAGFTHKLTIAGGATLTAGDVTMAGGTLDGAGTFEVTSVMGWTGGTMAGPGVTQIDAGAMLILNSANGKTLDGRQLGLQGNTTLDGTGNLTVKNGAVINNQASITYQRSVNIVSGGGADSTLINSGNITIDPPLAPPVPPVTIDALFEHFGSLLANTTLSFGKGVELLGGTMDGGATLNFNGGLHWQDGTITNTGYQGPSDVYFNVGPVIIDNPAPNVHLLQSRTVYNTTTVTLLGDILAQPVTLVLDTSTFHNQLSFRMQGYASILDGGGDTRIVTEAVNGQFIQESTPQGVTGPAVIEVDTFDNDGQLFVLGNELRVRSGGRDRGDIDIAAGATLYYENPKSKGITYELQSNAGVVPLITGDGWVRVDHKMVFIVNTNALIPRLVLAGSPDTQLVGGPFTIGTFHWYDGGVGGTGGPITITEELRLLAPQPASNKKLIGKELSILGNVVWLGDDLRLGSVSVGVPPVIVPAIITLDGQAGKGILDIQTDSKIKDLDKKGNKIVLKNGGQIKKTASPTNARTFIEVPVEGSGTVRDLGHKLDIFRVKLLSGLFEVIGEVVVDTSFEQAGGTVTVGIGSEPGTLIVGGPYTQSGGAVNLDPGTTLSVSGLYTLSGGTVYAYGYQGSTSTLLDVTELDQSGGTLTIDVYATLSADTVSVSGGTLVLSGGQIDAVTVVEILSGGTFNARGTLNGDVNNYGTIKNATGTLVVNGNYTQSGTGTLNVEINGVYPGHDRLQVNGLATLGGILNVSFIGGYLAYPGTNFSVLTYTSRSGTFATVNLPSLQQGSWDPRYDDPAGTFTLWVMYQ